jgi:hypothetical protein
MLFLFSNPHVSNAVMLVNGQAMNSKRKKKASYDGSSINFWRARWLVNLLRSCVFESLVVEI